MARRHLKQRPEEISHRRVQSVATEQAAFAGLHGGAADMIGENG